MGDGSSRENIPNCWRGQLAVDGRNFDPVPLKPYGILTIMVEVKFVTRNLPAISPTRDRRFKLAFQPKSLERVLVQSHLPK